MKTLLAVSPHLDDAIFSAGAFLARHAAAGWRVVVATCFTATVPNPRGFALACQLDKGLPPEADYMALRRAEDRAACTVIGAEAVHLPFPEAPHRGYESAAALFGPAHAQDDIASLARALAELHDQLRPDLLLGPACTGDHVDHWAVRRALPAPAMLWADLPYARRIEGHPAPPFELTACGLELDRKLTASRHYATQLPFQLGPDLDVSLLHFGGAEAFRPTP